MAALGALGDEGYLDCLHLLHFHVGSQITNIRMVKEVRCAPLCPAALAASESLSACRAPCSGLGCCPAAPAPPSHPCPAPHIHPTGPTPQVMREAAFLYAELVQLGAPMGFLDCGGGLAVDYDGSFTDTGDSMAYTLQHYANDGAGGGGRAGGGAAARTLWPGEPGCGATHPYPSIAPLLPRLQSCRRCRRCASSAPSRRPPS